jgi:ubiquinone/menaquinone biosynthesis C-methylase UbiE
MDLLLGDLDLAGKRVLDIGCGAGELVHRMARAGAQAVGIDPNPKRIAQARKDAPKGATFEEGVGEKLPFGDATLDIVVFFNSLHHVPAKAMDGALAEAARVLKRGGILYVSEPVAEGPYFEAMKPVNDETVVRKQALEALDRAVAAGAFREQDKPRINRVVGVEKSFESFCTHMIETEPKRAALIAAKKNELQAGFEKHGTKTEGGYAFERLTRFNRYTRA